jgi:hypothetical protein
MNITENLLLTVLRVGGGELNSSGGKWFPSLIEVMAFLCYLIVTEWVRLDPKGSAFLGLSKCPWIVGRL